MGLRLSLPVSTPKNSSVHSLRLPLSHCLQFLSFSHWDQCNVHSPGKYMLADQNGEWNLKQSAESHLYLNKYCWSNCKSEQFFSSRATIKVFARGVRCSTCSHHQLIPSGDNYTTHTHSTPLHSSRTLKINPLNSVLPHSNYSFWNHYLKLAAEHLSCWFHWCGAMHPADARAQEASAWHAVWSQAVVMIACRC